MSASAPAGLTWPITGAPVVIAPIEALATIAMQTVVLAGALLLAALAVRSARRRAGWHRFTELRDGYDEPSDPEGLAAAPKARLAMYALAARREVAPRWMDHLIAALSAAYVAVVLYAALATLSLVPYPMLVHLP